MLAMFREGATKRIEIEVEGEEMSQSKMVSLLKLKPKHYACLNRVRPRLRKRALHEAICNDMSSFTEKVNVKILNRFAFLLFTS